MTKFTLFPAPVFQSLDINVILLVSMVTNQDLQGKQLPYQSFHFLYPREQSCSSSHYREYKATLFMLYHPGILLEKKSSKMLWLHIIKVFYCKNIQSFIIF